MSDEKKVFKIPRACGKSTDIGKYMQKLQDAQKHIFESQAVPIEFVFEPAYPVKMLDFKLLEEEDKPNE